MWWKEFISSFLQNFLSIVVPILVTGLVGILAALAKKGIDWLMAKINLLGAQKSEVLHQVLEAAARAAVLSAEQLKLAKKIEEKKDYAVDYVTKYLASQGYHIDLAIIADAVEAAVMDQFNRSRV